MKHWFSDLREFRRDPLNYLNDRGGSAEGSFVRMYLGPPVFLVVEPEAIKKVLKASEDKIDKGSLVHKLRVIIGENSLTLSGETQKKRRMAIHEQLTRGMSAEYVSQISTIIREQLSAETQKGMFNAHKTMAPLALRIVSSILFGPGALSSADEKDLIHAINLVEDEVADSMFRLLPSPLAYLRKMRHIKTARAIMRDVVVNSQDKATETSLLHALLEQGLTSDELCDEVLMLFLAGHHTTGSAAAWVLYYMATEERLQEKLAEEADSIRDENGEFIPSLLNKAPISNALVQEVLRLYPSAWWYSRESSQDVEIDGHTFKKGTSFIISPWHLGRDDKFWQNPSEFHLDRDYKKNPAYLPFGAGPRACVGMRLALMELQLIALNIASTHTLKYNSEYPAPTPTPLVALTPPEMLMELIEKK